MSNNQFLFRAGSWLAFLITALELSLVYFYDPPTAVGSSVLRLFISGAIVGIGLGSAVYSLYRPLSERDTQAARLTSLFGILSVSVFGGAAGAALLDRSRIVDAREIELPIVQIEQPPTGRREDARIATLAPLEPTYEDAIPASRVDGRWVREGDCLHGVVERGWLGGTWVSRYTAGPCSKERGAPSAHVVTDGTSVTTWRWYKPGINRSDGEGRRTDEALPSNLTCLTRQGSCLYRCDQRTSRAESVSSERLSRRADEAQKTMLYGAIGPPQNPEDWRRRIR